MGSLRHDEIRKLREQKLELVQELRSTNETAQKWADENKQPMQAEDSEKLERIGADILAINARLEAEYRTERLSMDDPEQLVQLELGEGNPRNFNEYRAMNAPVKVQDEPEVRRAVYSWMVRGRDGMDPGEYRVLSKAASGGGFLVDSDMADMIVRASRFLPGGVGALARVLVTGDGDSILVPTNLTHGTAAWISESAAYTPSDETMTQASLSAYKAGTKVIVSEELLTDSEFDLGSFLATEFGERIGALAETAFITGDGSGKPTGITDAASAVSAATLPAGYVTTLAWAGLAAAVYAVPPQYRDGMSLLVSDTFFVKLIGTQDSTGAPLWNAGTAGGAPDTFAGIPIYTHPNLAAVGANAKAGIVGNFNKGYWIRRVGGVFMQRQNELHSDNGQVGFRAYLRMDGKVVLADALRVVTFAAT